MTSEKNAGSIPRTELQRTPDPEARGALPQSRVSKFTLDDSFCIIEDLQT